MYGWRYMYAYVSMIVLVEHIIALRCVIWYILCLYTMHTHAFNDTHFYSLLQVAAWCSTSSYCCPKSNRKKQVSLLGQCNTVVMVVSLQNRDTSKEIWFDEVNLPWGGGTLVTTTTINVTALRFYVALVRLLLQKLWYEHGNIEEAWFDGDVVCGLWEKWDDDKG